ncbi:MAG: hypothetical protein IE916_04175 [Epsilonproteobacteria bacterium]|nr:hypothetical protein [Campylobacterota bacterium]
MRFEYIYLLCALLLSGCDSPTSTPNPLSIHNNGLGAIHADTPFKLHEIESKLRSYRVESYSASPNSKNKSLMRVSHAKRDVAYISTYSHAKEHADVDEIIVVSDIVTTPFKTKIGKPRESGDIFTCQEHQKHLLCTSANHGNLSAVFQMNADREWILEEIVWSSHAKN